MSEWKEVDTVCTGENYKIVIEMIQRPMYRWHAWSADRATELGFGEETWDVEEAISEGYKKGEKLEEKLQRELYRKIQKERKLQRERQRKLV